MKFICHRCDILKISLLYKELLYSDLKKSRNKAEKWVKVVNMQFLEKEQTIVVKLTSNQNNENRKILFSPMR